MPDQRSDLPQAIIDKLLLREIAMRYARAIDRRDRDLLLSCYHPDAIDHHGNMFRDGPVAYADWQPGIMSPFEVTAHYIMNCNYRLDGNIAEGELYFIAFHREQESQKHIWVGGRYLDRYEFRDGEWRILHRAIVWDFVEAREPGQDDLAFLRSLGDVGQGATDASFSALPLFGKVVS